MSNYQYKVNGVDYNVVIEEIEGNVAKVTVNGKPFDVELSQPVKAKPQQKKVQKVAPAPTSSNTEKAPAIKPKAAVGAGNKEGTEPVSMTATWTENDITVALIANENKINPSAFVLLRDIFCKRSKRKHT